MEPRTLDRTLAGALVAIGAVVAACAPADAGDVDGGRDLGAGLQRMEALVAERAFDDALAVADGLLEPDWGSWLRTELEGWTRGVSESLLSPVTAVLDAVGVDALSALDRGEIEYARALTLLASAAELDAEGAEARIERATGSLAAARRAGGPAALSAVEVLGDLQLAAAEAVRSTIPEIAARETTGPVAPPPPGPSDMAAKDDSDPLEEARGLYLAARERFVERLTLASRVEGGGDVADVRANTELVIRRLRELDELERQREEQKQPNDKDPSSDQKNEDKEPEDGEENPEDEGDPSESDKPEDPSPSEDDSDAESQDPNEDEPQETPEEDDAEGEESAPEEEISDAPEEQPEERQVTEVEMTAEEQQRLMEKNRAYQEAGDERRRLLRVRRRGTSKRDW